MFSFLDKVNKITDFFFTFANSDVVDQPDVSIAEIKQYKNFTHPFLFPLHKQLRYFFIGLGKCCKKVSFYQSYHNLKRLNLTSMEQEEFFYIVGSNSVERHSLR